MWCQRAGFHNNFQIVFPLLRHEAFIQFTSHAESYTRQEMFSLADVCRITAGAHNLHNTSDTIPNKQANTSVD